MKVPLYQLDTPNKNNRIYPKELMRKEIDRLQTNIKERKLLVYQQYRPDNSYGVSDVIGVVNGMTIENDFLMADIEFLQLPISQDAQVGISTGELSVRSMGVGLLKEGKQGEQIVEQYRCDGFIVTDDPA